MKLTAVKPFQITVGGDSFIFVKAETDQGIYGLGDADNLAMGRTRFEAITHYGRLMERILMSVNGILSRCSNAGSMAMHPFGSTYFTTSQTTTCVGQI
jgi:hypothetical protein